MAAAVTSGDSRWAPNCLLVCNLHPNIPNVQSVLQDYFEDNSRSGGGKVSAVIKTQSEREGLVEFEQRLDADTVKRRKSHTVTVNGVDYPLEVIKCPMTIYLKYRGSERRSSTTSSSNSTEDFVVLTKPEEPQLPQESSNEEGANTSSLDLTIDNQPSDVSVPARPSPRDSSYSAVQMTLPECYQSEEVLRLQREKEERFKSLQYYDKKIKEAVEKEKLRQSMIQLPEEQESLKEKAFYESTEKDKAVKLSEAGDLGKAPDQIEMETHLKKEQPTPKSSLIGTHPSLQFQRQSAGDGVLTTPGDGVLTTPKSSLIGTHPSLQFQRQSAGDGVLTEQPIVQLDHGQELSSQSDSVLTGHYSQGRHGLPGHTDTGEPGQGFPNYQKRVVPKTAAAEHQPPVKKVHTTNTLDLDDVDLYSAAGQVNTDAMEEYEVASRTVVVEGLAQGVDVEMVELFFESSKKCGGGPLEKLDFQEKSGRAILVYENKQDADTVLSKKQFTVAGSVVTVSPHTVEPKDTAAQNTSNTSEEDIVVKVTGITPDMSEEMLSLYFEHERKSGGGDIKEFDVDYQKGEAVVTFENPTVAERVLARKTLDFKKSQMIVSRLEKPRWDKRTVLVTGFAMMNEEMLELLYENKKKSGGGPIECITMLEGNSAALVTFMNEADAEQVLHQGFVKRMDGSVISASKPTDVPIETGATAAASPRRQEPTPNIVTNSIMVLGIDENMNEDVLEMLFENEAKSGGGPVEKITIDPEFGMAVVTFLKTKVAQRVLAKGNVQFDNLNLIVQPHIPDNVPQPEGAEGGNDIPEEMEHSSHQEEPSASTSKYGKFNCIEVSGLPPTTSEEFVRLFFESGRYSNGGEIDNLTLNLENGTAVIIFKEESTTKKVLQRHQESPLKIENCKLQIKAIDTSLYGGTIPANTSCAIQVTGLPVNASDESILMFFENRRISGGDALEDIMHCPTEGRAVLTYHTTEVAQRVIKKHEAQPIQFEGSLLQIQMLYSNSRPAQVLGPKEANVLLLKNVNEEADADDIRFFLERVPKCKVQECAFGVKQGTVLVHFIFMPGFEKFYELSCQKPLKGSMVNIESVPLSKSIEVYGAESLSSQKILMYFEHPKSKGGEVANVDILTEEKCAIVTFVKLGVAEKVLSQSEHTVERRQLILRLHRECFGILPPHHDHTKPGAGIPSNCLVDNCHPDILSFILSTPPNRKYIEDGMASVYGKVIWPDQITDNVQVQIDCTLQRNMPGLSSKVKTWSVDVTGVFEQMLSDFYKDEINVLQEAWKEFLSVTRDLMPQNSDDVEVTVSQDTCTLVAVGKRNTVEQMMDNLRQASAKVEEKLQRQSQIIPETVNNLKAYQIKFLLAQKFPQQTKQIFQDMKIEADLKQKKVVFTGVPSDIITAKLQMYELVNQMRYDKLTFTKPVCNLLKQKKTREYLVNQFQTRDAIVVWDVSDKNDGEVMVYAKTAEELTSGVAIIKSCIVEHILNVPDENKPCLRQPSWSMMKDGMLKDNDGELRINVAEDTSSISVAANSQIIEGVLEQIKTYMTENTVLEKFANMDRGTAILLENEKNQDLRKIEDDFKDFSVKLCPSGKRRKPATKKVLQRHQESPLKIENCKLQIKAIDTSLYGGTIPANTSCAIQVTGLPVNASDESILMFFENRRISGGDALEDIMHCPTEGRAVLTYHTTEVAQRMIKKHEAQPIQFEGSLLQIQMLYSNSRPAQALGPREANVLLLKNVNEEADADDIRFFLERVPKCKVQECAFGVKQGTVLVHFIFMPGFEKFYELSCQKPLKGSMVNIESVPLSKSIEVYGAESLSSQKILMYFEHPKSKGGEVANVDILTEEKCAIVTFVKHGVAEKVLSQSEHTVERRQLILRLHRECFGILPPHHDHTKPGAGIPSNCLVDNCHPDILSFILSTPPNRKYIEDGMASVYGKVIWPDQITDNVQVQIDCTLQRNMPGLSSKVKTWSVDVTGVFEQMLSDFYKDEINVLQEAWKEFLSVTRDLMPQNSDDVEVTVSQDTCTLVAVGKRNTVEQMMDNLRQASAKVEEKLQRQSQIIPETVNNLKAYQIKFLLAQKFPQQTKQIFQDMKIEADLKQKKVVFTGVPSDIITAKLQMYELVNQMRYDKLTFTKPVCNLLKQKKTREYLVNQFQTRDAIVVWDVSDKNDGEVMVYAKTAEELTSGVAIIKSCIVEHILNVPDENKPCLRQPSWSMMKDGMLKDNDGELRINVAEDTSSISVAANSQIIEGVLEQIKTYMTENTVLEKFANMDRGTAILLENEKNQDLRKIEDDFKDFSVKLCPSGKRRKPATKKVLQRHQESPLKIENCKLQIKAIDTSLYGGTIPANTSCAIQVTGLPVNASDESILMFFENRRISGGDALEDIMHCPTEGRAVLTYHTTEVAQRMIKKHEAQPIQFEGSLLQIQMLYSNSRPAQALGPREANVLLLKNVNEEADADDIRFFLERVPKCKVQECAFGVKQGTVLVHFIFMPGFEKFYELSCQKPLKGSMVNIESVPLSKSIEVYGAESLSSQKILMYFEHPKSKGGEVANVDILTEEKCAIVTFVKHGVAEKVLSQSEHTVERRQLILRLHRECFGILPPHHDHTKPGAGIPSNCLVDNCHPDILSFILSTPPNRKYIEDGMASVYGKVIWPDQITDNVQVQIDCTLQRNMPGLSSKVKTWSVDVTGVFEQMLSDFYKDEINVLQEAWKEFLSVTRDLMPQNSDDVEVTVSQDTCTLVAVGKRNTVEQMMDNLRQASAKVEEKLQRQSQIIPETVNNLKAYQIKFLLAQKFPQQTKQIFQDMKIEADLKQKKVVFTGVPSDIITAKLQMYELVNQMRYDKLTFTKPVCNLLKQKKTREYLVNQFQTRDAIVVWDVSDKNDGEVMVYAKTAEELTSGVAVIKSCIVEHILNVPDENKPCLRQPSWSMMKDGMLKDNDGELRINVAEDTSSISVAANSQIIEGVLEQIKTYMTENTVLEKFANMDRGTAILLENEKNQDLRKIEDDFKDFSVKLCPSGRRRKPGYIIRGTKLGLDRALTRISALAQTIIACDHKINKPGMPQYFLEDRGRGLLSSLESRYRVVIIVGDEDVDTTETEAPQHKGKKAPKADIKAIATLKRGHKVMVVQGDITAYCVDAIVNAANEEMLHIGGVAKAIVDKGGMEIQQECSKVVAIEGRLLPGQVYTSQAGKLPCRKVIHTVGPKWQGGFRNEENELYESVYACLEEASNKHSFRTIALPAISSGVFGFPKDKCCDTILSAVSDYFKKETSTTLKEVHLVDNKQTLVTALLNAAKNVLGQDTVKSTDQEEEDVAFPAGHFQAVDEATSHSAGSMDSDGTVYWTKVGNGILHSQQGIQVTIVKGSIINQQVDVIVNTTNKDLNLGSGGVSSMILNAAGPTIQQECHQKAPGGVQKGDVVETSGGNMQCSKIYHGACSNYKGPSSLQDLRQFLTNCLTRAHASGLSTIAIPAIGTGNLNFPRADVALAMYEVVKIFSEKHVGTSLQNIYFVLYDRDLPTVQAFEAEADRLLKPGSSKRRTVHRQLVKDRATSPEDQGAHGSSQRMSGGAYGSSQRMSGGAYGSSQRMSRPPSGFPSREISQLHMEHLKIVVVKGDITMETTDAIVNSTGDDLNFNSQVSRAILKAAGRSVAQECAQLGKVDKNHIAVTGAGNLGCSNIIHVGAPYDVDAFRYQKKWKTRVQDILKTAVALECSSVAFPALGTGTLSVNPSKMAATIFESFHEFGKKSTSLKEIRVVVFEDRMIETFQTELENMTKKGKGVLESLSEKFHSFMSGVSGMLGDYDIPVEETDEVPGQRESYYRRTPAPERHQSPIDESILCFHIYGFNKMSIDQVTDQIEKTCKDETQDKVLDSKYDQEVIKKLSDKQIKKIMSYEGSHFVKITIDKKHRIARLRIQGQHASVLQVMENIYRIFRETEQIDRDKQEAELLSKQVQWQFTEQGKFQTYPPDMNAVIEKAYLDKKPYVEFKERDPSGGTRCVRVTFSTMKETQMGVGGPGSETDVRRYTGETVDLPKSWSTMKKDDHFLLVDITSGTPEYATVEQSFQNSFTQGGGTYNKSYKTILKIQRLQNPSMYRKYMVHKVHLDAANPANTQNERILWHGTTDDTLGEIHTNGFNRSFCGRNGTAYGKGVYFATYATLSDGYAKPNAAGHRHMYQSKVLAGEFTRGDSSLLVPPAKDPNKPSIKFDSVVDNTTTPKIFVVFQDYQAYPEYLITYQ